MKTTKEKIIVGSRATTSLKTKEEVKALPELFTVELARAIRNNSLLGYRTMTRSQVASVVGKFTMTYKYRGVTYWNRYLVVTDKNGVNCAVCYESDAGRLVYQSMEVR